MPSKPKDDLVVVYTSPGMLTAETIKNKLESAGIPAMLKYESVGRIIGLTVDGLGQVEVLVPREREEEARALLEKT
ncbi:MAG: DUF2007 domain-containing protein [Chloroflexi bacterium]|nr:DUF2007 domain-containing protein [Chloroflexota bacterium]